MHTLDKPVKNASKFKRDLTTAFLIFLLLLASSFVLSLPWLLLTPWSLSFMESVLLTPPLSVDLFGFLIGCCATVAVMISVCPAPAKSSKSGFVRKLLCLSHWPRET